MTITTEEQTHIMGLCWDILGRAQHLWVWAGDAQPESDLKEMDKNKLRTFYEFVLLKISIFYEAQTKAKELLQIKGNSRDMTTKEPVLEGSKCSKILEQFTKWEY